MAKKFKIDVGWTIYEVSNDEIFRWGGMCICDSCNQDVLGYKSFLIPVMNVCYCKNCFDDWKRSSSFYKEDLKAEKNNIDYYDKILKLK